MRRYQEFVPVLHDMEMYAEYVPPHNRKAAKPTKIARPPVLVDSVWRIGGGRGSVKPKKDVAVKCANDTCVAFGSVWPSGLCHKCHLATLPPEAFAEVAK